MRAGTSHDDRKQSHSIIGNKVNFEYDSSTVTLIGLIIGAVKLVGKKSVSITSGIDTNAREMLAEEVEVTEGVNCVAITRDIHE